MLTVYFFAFTAAVYSLSVSGDEDTCKKRIESECDLNLFPENIPKTVDEGRKACRDIITVGECILKIRETCPGNINRTNSFKHTLEFVREACKEDSPIFKVISSNIQCISSADDFLFKLCMGSDISEPTRQFLKNSTRAYSEKRGSRLTPEEETCLEDMWDIFCPSILVNLHCGEEAGFAVRDILIEFADDETCPQELRGQFKPFLEIFKKAILQEQALKENGKH